MAAEILQDGAPYLPEPDEERFPGLTEDETLREYLRSLTRSLNLYFITQKTDADTLALAAGGTVVALTDGATPALDASLGTTFTLSAAGNRTIAIPTNATSGQKITIVHYASGGARTLALNAGAGGFRFGTDITALSATSSGKYDYIGCIYNAAATYWDVVGYVKGY